MCWNKEVSFGSFIIISLVSGLLYKRNLPNDRLMSIFIMSYGTMQLFETLIWLGIDYNNVILKKIGAFLANLLLFFHPLAIMIGLTYDNLYKIKFKNNIFWIIALLIFVMSAIFALYILITQKNKFIPYKSGNSDHVVWNFPHYHYVIVVLFGLVIAYKYIYPKNKIFTMFVVLFYIIPWLYTTLVFKDITVVGSYWCWIVAFFSFLIYFVNPLIKY